MRKNLGIKIMLFGIALIAYFPYAQAAMNDPDPGIFVSILIVIGTFSPIIGLVLCIIGLLYKKNEK